MPRKSTRLKKSLVSKYKNTPKEATPLQDSSDEASFDIEFTNPKGDSNEEDLIVPSSNSDEQSKEVPSVESNEQSKEVDESVFKEDSLRMARRKAPLTKTLVAKFKSTQKDISSSKREIEMNIKEKESDEEDEEDEDEDEEEEEEAEEGTRKESSNDFTVIRDELETLKPGFEINGNVLKCWAYILNNEEKFKNLATSSRIFLDVNAITPTMEPIPFHLGKDK
ncbi:hypothetical protein L6452_14913 [Arctium lappa]|uniref:Uncharacterized protein n=1 Tax=Arctium lappa TaxID=4217 RepID=A0ACB9CMX0_ARCLA|nr:hypothetical protein L6452_14913 [Arctium lappa]